MGYSEKFYDYYKKRVHVRKNDLCQAGKIVFNITKITSQGDVAFWSKLRHSNITNLPKGPWYDVHLVTLNCLYDMHSWFTWNEVGWLHHRNTLWYTGGAFHLWEERVWLPPEHQYFRVCVTLFLQKTAHILIQPSYLANTCHQQSACDFYYFTLMSQRWSGIACFMFLRRRKLVYNSNHPLTSQRRHC